MQNTTMRHHSVLVEYNSQQATSRSSVYGNGQFTCTLNNTNSLTHSIKVTPHKTIIPNVFNNVNEYNNYLEIMLIDPANFVPDPAVGIEANGGVVTMQMTLPVGFYTQQGLVNMFNATWASTAPVDAYLLKKGTLTLGVANSGAVASKISASLSPGAQGNQDWTFTTTVTQPPNYGPDAGFAVRASRDFFELMGWSNLIFHEDPDGKCYMWLSWINTPMQNTYDWINDHSQLPSSGETRTSMIPRMGGEHVVHIAINEAAPGNMVCSDSKARDILLTCSMHDVPYGQFMAFEAKDLYVDDIDYKTVTNLHRAQITLLDHKFRVLTVPENYPVSIILKVFHNDTHTM